MDNSFSKAENLQWCRMGPRATFGQFMIEIAKKNNRLMVISADLGRSSGLDRFKQLFPKNYLSVGISEQNMIGVASGLAREGFKVFITSFAPFLSMRASEHIRMNLGYMKHNVNLVALGSGVSMGFLGNSHFGLEDLSVMRAIPNISILSPADCGELKKTLYDCSFNDRGPTYIRLTGVPGSKMVYEKNYNYKFGRIVEITSGKKILILSTGSITGEALKAVIELNSQGYDIKMININSIKPLDKRLINICKKFKKIITIEEHLNIGGLFSSISELITKNNINSSIFSLSLGDKFGPNGKYEYLLDFHGLNSYKIKKFISKI